MPNCSPFRAAVRQTVDADLSTHVRQLRQEFAGLPGAVQLLDFAENLLGGGKRTRAQLLALGWLYTTGDASLSPAPRGGALAVELFQAAALVHDDLMDASATRRGQPTVHRAAAAQHAAKQRRGSADQFGAAAAILLGDLLLVQAQREFRRAAGVVPEAEPALRQYEQMAAELQLGQFLDVRAQTEPVGTPGGLETILEVLDYKSGRYSVEYPLVIGALLGGLSARQVEPLRAWARPLGIAFQLRDDALGVFGDSRTTGKPAGGDIHEGKRTALLELTWQHTDAAGRALLTDVYSTPTPAQAQVQAVSELMRTSGGEAAHETLIAQQVAAATAALANLPQGQAPRELFAEFATALTARSA